MGLIKEIKEFFCDSFEHRFEESIYRHYVDREKMMGVKFKKSSQNEFFEKLYKHKLQKRITIRSNPNDVHRPCDELEVWKGKFDTVLGEVWIQNGFSSYWIKE